MNLKSFIILITLLAVFEYIISVICFLFGNLGYRFNDYMEELYSKFGLDMDDETTGNYITGKFEDLFENYQDTLGYALIFLLSLFFLIINIVPMIIFIILYCCHLRRKNCSKCKRVWSYISLFISIILNIFDIWFACNAKYKINLPDYQIYQFDDAFNKRTRKNINFMKTRRIILIAGASLLYSLYIAHFILLCCFNKLLVIEIPGAVVTTENNDLAQNNNVIVNQVQIINTNERENKDKN